MRNVVPEATESMDIQPPQSGRNLFAYIGSRTTRQRRAIGAGISIFRFDEISGQFEYVGVEKALNPTYLAVDSASRRLYVAHGDTSQVSAYEVDANSGKLKLLNSQYSGGSNPVHLTLTAGENNLLVANYASGSLCSFPIRSDGSLGELEAYLELEGEVGPHRTQQHGAHPHQVQFDPSHTWCVSPDKGMDCVFVHRFDPALHSFIESSCSPLKSRSASGPRHIAFHPIRPFAYIANELDSSVTAYDFDVTSGRLVAKQILSTLSEDYFGENTASAIFTSHDGRFLYVSNRGCDSVVCYKIDNESGRLEMLNHQATCGKSPRFFTFSPSGNWLFAANSESHSIATFKVAPDCGSLELTGSLLEVGSPVCIVFAELGSATR